jgi:redox-sensitive bicupin YhaK (pirin superfamily)
VATSFPSVVDAQAETHGDAMRVRGLNPSDFPSSTSPLLMLHHFELYQDFFGPHPHAGFSAVTYLFPDSATGMRNRDSLGALVDIEAGDLYWTFAGRGVLHHERPIALGSRCHGLQFFINASASRKHDPPHALHLPSAEAPLIQTEGVTARLLAGASHGMHAPIDTPEPFTMFDITLSAGGSFAYTIPSGWSATLYVHEGHLDAVLGHAAPTPLHRSQAVSTPESEQPQQLTLTGDDAQAILFSGPILHEPVFMGGPFVMTSQEELRQAFADYRAGRMGTLAAATAPTTRP